MYERFTFMWKGKLHSYYLEDGEPNFIYDVGTYLDELEKENLSLREENDIKDDEISFLEGEVQWMEQELEDLQNLV